MQQPALCELHNGRGDEENGRQRQQKYGMGPVVPPQSRALRDEVVHQSESDQKQVGGEGSLEDAKRFQSVGTGQTYGQQGVCQIDDNESALGSKSSLPSPEPISVQIFPEQQHDESQG